MLDGDSGEWCLLSEMKPASAVAVHVPLSIPSDLCQCH